MKRFASSTLVGLVIALGLSPSGHAQEGDAKETREAIMLTHDVSLEPLGRIKASAGLYVKIREDRFGTYWAGGRFEGSGHVTGALPGVVHSPGIGRAIVLPTLNRAWFLQIQPNGMLCGTDKDFNPLGCIRTDALVTSRPHTPPPAGAAAPVGDKPAGQDF